MQAKAQTMRARVFRPCGTGLSRKFSWRWAKEEAHKKAPSARVTPLSVNGERTKLCKNKTAKAGAAQESSTGLEELVFAPFSVAGITSQPVIELFPSFHPGSVCRRRHHTIAQIKVVDRLGKFLFVLPPGKVKGQPSTLLVAQLKPRHAMLRVDFLRRLQPGIKERRGSLGTNC